MVAHWLALLPHRKKDLGLRPAFLMFYPRRHGFSRVTPVSSHNPKTGKRYVDLLLEETVRRCDSTRLSPNVS